MSSQSQPTNVVLIGKKPPMNYVLAVLTLFQNGQDQVILKARGMAISKAVDVSQILKNRFLKDVDVKDIRIGTEQVDNQQTGGKSNVSSIEIVLQRGA
ncbi:MAG TPA: DNA-binding protein Alba [Nitrososphaeria archaeon]|nr:DNA-binding protein Alba [Conexivisphaerales archaeon]PMP94462.1 MAG: DNA-binding protein Alba [Nitrososphaera sp.]HEU16972.1 DNA-binding protein Alba [Nitrososphaeria archaeon]